jgi:uncharacterized protein YdaU (DUF1376 family)
MPGRASDELPYMTLWVRDVLADIAALDAEERGAYLSLMIACWSEGGSLPLDPRRLARLAAVDADRWPRVWEAIGGYFVVADGQTIHHATVDAEMTRARDAQGSRRRGAAAANAQRAAQRAAQRTPSDTPSARGAVRSEGRSDPAIPSPSPSPSPDPTPDPTPVGSGASNRFMIAGRTGQAPVTMDYPVGDLTGDMR